MPGTLPHDMSSASLRSHYRERLPLFDAYLAVIAERNTSSTPITEPMPTAGAVTNHQAAKIALQRLGRPADELSVEMATAWMERLEDEIASLSDKKASLDDLVTGHFFTLAGCVPFPKDWLGEDAEERREDASEIARQLDDEQIVEVVELALPAVLERIIARDAQRRRNTAGGAS